MRISDWSSDVCSSDLVFEVGDLRSDIGLRLLHALTIDAVIDPGTHLFFTNLCIILHRYFNDIAVHLRSDNGRLATVIGIVGCLLGGCKGRSEERRVGDGGISQCRSLWSLCTYKKKTTINTQLQ